ncbi:choline transporter-like protein ctl1 [Diplogelasinospora grovesii]|uniref:Protein PNS1 n=1 Tax=Diplogelasinospora grovesii TaxID=303347 RepID=A0AAN6NJD7_9PEZI|nr:choline transporter-like protein ctl1 [Diplogelasinospora grovesii]
MFSEYASRFLAQSQSRISNFGGQDNNDRPTRQQPTDWTGRGSRLGGRSYLGRGQGNPYQPSGSRFGNLAAFGSRYATQDAPLFQAALEHEEEEEEERDREAADLYALQRSRRVFAASRLEESTENEDDGGRSSVQSQDYEERSFGERLRGIRSSWNGSRNHQGRGRSGQAATVQEEDGELLRRQISNDSDDAKGRMVDVGLESTIADSEPPIDLTMETPADDSPPAFQKFQAPNPNTAATPVRYPLRRDSTHDSELGMPPPSSAADTTAGAAIVPPASDGEIFKHDAFFAWIYLIAQASLLSTFVLVFLHTEGKSPRGDTIYTVLRASFELLAVDTLVSIIVSLVWLAALRSFVKPLVTLIMVAVPVILVSFSLYPFISSYQTTSGSTRFQDVVMRWAAIVPAISAVVWLYLVYKGRHAIRSAMDILEFSSRILTANSALILVGMACLGVIVLWTWAWLFMFTRVFLGGSSSSKLARFVISASSWWLGAYFVLMYIWTLSIISGVQRGTTAATVSQWYFHRNAVPQPASRDIVSAALGHSLTTIFGTISLSTLLALAIRMPLLVLPQRAANILSMIAYSFIPTPIAALTNPLTLTYAAIHSQTLAMSARGLSQMDFLAPQRPTTTLTPAALPKGQHRHSPLLPYRLAKLILHATRFIMAIALGFAGWVMTARQLNLDGSSGGIGATMKGSAYAYVVGMVASFIGWGILGAMEGILSGIVDAVVICYGSESRMASGAGGYCMEAAMLFGDKRADRVRRDDDIY